MTCDKTPQCPSPCGLCPERWPVPAGSEYGEPVADGGKWEGAEEWMPLAWKLCANECGEEACMSLVWEGGPIPEPWGERWLKYEDQAKEMIATVRRLVPSPAASVPAQAGGVAVPESVDYTPGDWYMAKGADDMQRFFRSRLPSIRDAAREHGYAIGVHGSERRDFDLIAVPWRDGASEPDVLAHAIAKAACGLTRAGAYQWETKPAGRIAVSLPICWTDDRRPSAGHIDLSLLQPAPAPAQPEKVEVEQQLAAPANSLPDWEECQLRVHNSNFIEKRVAEGGYGAEPDSKLATQLHRFIYEYDDAEPYRSAWFLHRLELVLNEVHESAQPQLSEAEIDAAFRRAYDTEPDTRNDRRWFDLGVRAAMQQKGGAV